MFSAQSCTRRALATGMFAAVAVTGAAAQGMPRGTIHPLLQQALAEVPGREVRMLVLDLPPGGGDPAHRHPGHHVFGYVLEGGFRFRLDDQPERVLHRGDAFHESPGQLHAVGRNASDNAPAKVLVVVVAESGKPVAVPAP